MSVVSYSTPPSEREALLNKADRIFYVCGTEKEIHRLYEPIHIGQNAYHHDYNRLHFVAKYRSKCTNITFNKRVSVLYKASQLPSGASSISNDCCTPAYQFSHVLSNTPLGENLQTIVNVGVLEAREVLMNCTPQRKKAFMNDHFVGSIGYVLSPLRTQNSESSSQFSSAFSSPNSFNGVHENHKHYIKLPIENMLLIKLIIGDDLKFDECGKYSSLSQRANRGKLGRIALKLLLHKMELDINQRVKKHFKKSKHLKTMNKNISFDDQPLDKQPEVFFSEDFAISSKYL